MGRNLGPWQEEVVGNDPTGRNPRRVAGDGDPARASSAVLEQERETWGERQVNGYGEWELPCPSHNPPRALVSTVVPRFIAVVPLGRKYRTEAVVPLSQAVVKNYCRVGR